jgi:hypothetical protein
MTNESLEQYIEMYNLGSWDVPFNSYRISRSVVLGKVWTKYPDGETSCEESHNFFFIENDSTCVAIVLEMGSYDIHWLVEESMRKKGLLYKALKETILPFMFQDGRENQRATANSDENASYLARQGFEHEIDNNKSAYFLSKSSVDSYDESQIQRTPISDDEFKVINKKIFKLAAELRVIRDQIECSYGDDFCIHDVAYEVKDLGYELEYECKKS